MTGRPLRWVEDVFEHVGSHGLAVVSQRCDLVWDVAPRGACTWSGIVPPDHAATVCRLLREARPGHDVRRRDRSTGSA